MTAQFFIADLHVHSKYSRATARNLDLEQMYVWSQLKGITVVGTGDFTHPAWFSEITDKLVPAEPGLFRLRPDIARCYDEAVPDSCRAPVRFMLSCEISNIYKKNRQTRKNHNLVFFPDLDCVGRFNERLGAIGNIISDGRPILGLDARDLLEIVLETTEDGFLVPAHIWTPWFSMLGSKSGFDSLEACFDDLSSHIFAAETGLSSDPAMNWRVSNLDKITLISNSDAHSPAKLGREANLFNTEMSYFAIRAAMENGDGKQFLGTFEFYPEEGKYHVDGHRKCGVWFNPEETKAHAGVCPVCGKPLTLGVLHRVQDLATRSDGVRPARAFPFHRLIPLDDLLSQILRVGPQSKKVKKTYKDLLANIGSEFNILHFLERDKLISAGVPLLDEAIFRMRDNQVSFNPGFDGLFGTLQLFTDGERDRLLGQNVLFDAFEKRVETTTADNRPTRLNGSDRVNQTVADDRRTPSEPIIELNSDQRKAVDHSHGHLMIVAGPGTGKTRTLAHKIARLIESGTDVQTMLAVTFTNKAAGEMKERLQRLLGNTCPLPFVGTFHALGYRILSASAADIPLGVADEATRRSLIRDAMTLSGIAAKKHAIGADDLMAWIAGAKQKMLSSKDSLKNSCPADRLAEFTAIYGTYERLLNLHHLVDFEDLIFRSVRSLENDPIAVRRYLGRFSHLFIDEFQDINAGQYRLVKLLAGNHARICVIGDPDQSIYGFRGSDAGCFTWLARDFSGVDSVFLNRNYRSTQTILDVSSQIIRHNPESSDTGQRRTIHSDLTGERTIHIMEVATPNAEAVAVGKTIEQMVGGTGFLSLDSGSVASGEDRPPLSFADFAVLVRTRSQIEPIDHFLTQAGIPCQVVDRRRIFENPGIQGWLAVFRLIHDRGLFSDLAIARSMFKPSISVKTVDQLKSWAYNKDLSLNEALAQSRRLPIANMTLSRQKRLFQFILRLSAFKEKTAGCSVADTLEYVSANLPLVQSGDGDRDFDKARHRLMDIGKSYTADPGGFLAALTLIGDTDTYDHRAEKVSLLTMHAAKGLEFPVVFIAGCEDEFIPYRAPNRPVDPEEERRLFYVAITRAKQHLFLTKAGVRRINGQKRPRQLSPFVKDIENRYKHLSDQTDRKPVKPAQKQLLLF